MFKNSKGFSLVEVMVVVGIIGTLAAIGVPTFWDLQMKRRQATALAHLNGLYSGLKMFHSEWLVYNGDFRNIGFELSGEVYWRIGFVLGAGTPSTNIPNNYIGPGAQAGAAGFAVNTNPAAGYCGAGLRCQENGYIQGFNPPGFNLRWIEHTFLAGAATRFPWEPGSRDQVALMIDEQKRITKHSW
ncbi:MAG: prepilin-type N-terminal cleavage/methylation domain-containing protein [Bdellovibrionales bacterium]|nr:prepilin-type N-terminal cleavage/methylation domain-containing protein [Bdellovibrionales bacterium]